MKKRFIVLLDDFNPAIIDSESGLRLFFLASSGMGVPSTTLTLAEAICDFLNEKHANDVLYPEAFNQP